MSEFSSIGGHSDGAGTSLHGVGEGEGEHTLELESESQWSSQIMPKFKTAL